METAATSEVRIAKRRGVTAGIVLSGFVAIALSAVCEPAVATAGEARPQGTPSVVLAKNALVEQRLIRIAIAKSKSRPESTDEYFRFKELHGDLVFDLLLNEVIGASRDPRARDVLAELGSYYFGEGAFTTYNCIVLKRGRSMLQSLATAANATPPDCERFVGSLDPQVRESLGLPSSLCLDKVTMAKNIRVLEEGIRNGKKCPQ